MIQFLLGLFIGSIVGFVVFAVCSMAGTDDLIERSVNKETGDSDTRNK